MSDLLWANQGVSPIPKHTAPDGQASLFTS